MHVKKQRNRNFPLKTALLAGLALASPYAANAQVPTFFPLSSIDGTNGFYVAGTFGDSMQVNESSTVGDFNGDGIDDILIQRAPGSAAGTDRFAVIFGQTNSPAPNYEGTLISSSEGFVISFSPSTAEALPVTAGDFNGDGIDDIVIGDASYSSYNGRLAVLLGRSGTLPSEILPIDLTLTQINLGESSGFGTSLASGDFNGDGIDDIIAGVPNQGSLNGGAVVIYGSTSFSTGNVVLSELGSMYGLLSADGSQSLEGRIVASAGDFNDDGFDDVLTSTGIGGSATPGVNIYFGNSAGLTFQGKDFSLFGNVTDFNGAGDFNNDGIDDIIIGLGGNASAVVFFGSTLPATGDFGIGSSPFANVRFDAGNGNFGLEVAGVGDVNGDGFDDVAIGNPTATNNSINAGNAVILFGSSSPSNLTSVYSDLSPSVGFLIFESRSGFDNSGIGSGLAGGDFNDDGFSDILLSAPNASQSFYTGLAYVVFGDGESSSTPPPPPTDTEGPLLTLDRLVTNQLSFTLTGTYSDPSGVRRVRARISDDGRNVLPREVQSFTNPFQTAGSFAIPFAPATLADGVYDVEADARDNAAMMGGAANNDSVAFFENSFIYDTTSPSFQFAFGLPLGILGKGIGSGFPDLSDLDIPGLINDVFTCASVGENGGLLVIFDDISAVEIVNLPAILAASTPGISINGFESIATFEIDEDVSVSVLALAAEFPADGEYEIVFPVGSLQDEATNSNTTEISVCVNYDTQAPELQCERAFQPVGGSVHFINEPVEFTLKFTEPVVGVTPDNFFVDSGNGYIRSVYPVLIPSDTYTIEVVPYSFFEPFSLASKNTVGFFDVLALGFEDNGHIYDLAGNRFEGDVANETSVKGGPSTSTFYASTGLTFPFADLPDPALLISEENSSFDGFGTSVALDQATAVVGAKGAGNAGLAYVFEAYGLPEFDGPIDINPFGFDEPIPVEEIDFTTTFTQQTVLVGPDTQANDFFGSEVAVSGDWVAVGAPYHDDPASPISRGNAGAVYIYNRSLDFFKSGSDEKIIIEPGVFDWEFTQKIMAPTPALNSRFGTKIDIFGNIMAISEPYERNGGAVYIYVLDTCSQTWEFEQKIQPTDISRNDDFGLSIALNGNSILIGSPRDDDRGTDTGSAYMFSRLNGFWLPLEKFVPNQASRLDRIGTAVDLSNLFAAIGSPGHDYDATEGGAPAIRDAGRIYTYINQYEYYEIFGEDGPLDGIFVSESGLASFIGWVPFDRIGTRNVALNSDGIGSTLAISGYDIIAGAPRADLFGVDTGAAYLYRSTFFSDDLLGAPGEKIIFLDEPEGSYRLYDVLSHPNPQRNDLFAHDLDLTGNYALIGIPSGSHPKKDLGAEDSGLGIFFDVDQYLPRR